MLNDDGAGELPIAVNNRIGDGFIHGLRREARNGEFLTVIQLDAFDLLVAALSDEAADLGECLNKRCRNLSNLRVGAHHRAPQVADYHLGNLWWEQENFAGTLEPASLVDKSQLAEEARGRLGCVCAFARAAALYLEESSRFVE